MKKYEKVLLFGTPAIRAKLIPAKYSGQINYRSNPRIATLNDVLTDCLMTDKMVNLFHSTVSKPEDSFHDAVHFEDSASADLANAIGNAFYCHLSHQDQLIRDG